jgi:hypothetical protein
MATTRFLVPALWIALTLLLGVEAYLALIACGASLFGFQFLYCPAPVAARTAPSADLAELQRSIAAAEARLAERPVCRAGNPAPPLQIPAQLQPSRP